MFKYKKFLLIIVFITITVILGYLIYAVFFKSARPQPPAIIEPITTTSTGFPISPTGTGQIISESDKTQKFPQEEIIKFNIQETAQGGITKTSELTQTESMNATLNNSRSGMQYYNKQDGKFYKINQNGEITSLTDKIFYNINNITWAPDKNKAILEYPDGSNILYNFQTNKQITLPKHWEDFNFSPQDNKITAKSIGVDPDNRWLIIANEDGSRARAIEAIGENADSVYPSWSPNNQTIAMYTRGVDFNRQEVFFVGINNENFKSTIVEGRGFQHNWSPKGDRLLYSVYSSQNDLKPQLWIVDAQGDNIGNNKKNLNIETWAHKCSFINNNELYCAVPKQLEKGAGLFPELAKNTYDQIYKVNTITGLKKLVAIPEGEYNISNLNITNENIYFTDENTGKIYKIKLK